MQSGLSGKAARCRRMQRLFYSNLVTAVTIEKGVILGKVIDKSHQAIGPLMPYIDQGTA